MSDDAGHDAAQPASRPTSKPDSRQPASAPSTATSATAAAPAPLKIEAAGLGVPPSREGEPLSPVSPGTTTPNPFGMRKATSFDLDDYFTGPRDMSRHSKWPLFLQMHGSILPKMVIPLLVIGGWATAVSLISLKVCDLGVSSTLLTVLGFVVGLGLSFRSSTAYERYAEGRRYWSMLLLASQALGRVFWVHARFPADRDPREVMLKKVSGMNLILAFALALKHRLRFEPYTAYEDLDQLVAHLTTLSGEATAADPARAARPAKNVFKEIGEYLGVSFANSNPRKQLKKAQFPLGNLPLEILSYLAMAVDNLVADGQLPVPMTQTIAYNNVGVLNDVLTGTDRVLNTPLPIAYCIAISQITWVYVLLLPFQLYPVLGLLTIPATVAASYIILGILMIGREIENPFGSDVNDLPLEMFCDQVATDLDIIASHELDSANAFMDSAKNLPMYPASMASYRTWMKRSEDKVREAIRTKPSVTFASKVAAFKNAGKPPATKSAEDMV